MNILPSLRKDITLDSTPLLIDGEPTYLLIDPIKNNYFRIDDKTLLILRHWESISVEKLLTKLNALHAQPITEEDLKQTLQFLMQHELIQATTTEATEAILQATQKKRGKWLQKLIHHYLFFKLRLLKPDAYLNATRPYVEKIFFSRTYWLLVALAAMMGLYLTLPQWDEFFQAFDHILSAEGAVYIFFAMAIVKSIHELGHAYIAKHYGCHVHAIGIAFIVLFPILYTDTSDAWRLKNPRHRLLIDLGGIIAELQLMAWLLLFWHLIDNPILKNLFVYSISVGLISTLLINLNPLVRFDGYYAFSNFVKIENLQDRSFMLGRWKLRYWLIGLEEKIPVETTRLKTQIMIAYAYLVWIYRFFLFLGIAILVYYLFFKVLGIILFLIEIWYFILSPIVAELIVYLTHLKTIPFNRHIGTTLGVLSTICLLIIIPWQNKLIVPAVISLQEKHDFYTHYDNLAIQIPYKNNDPVKQEKMVYQGTAPYLDFQKNYTLIKIEQLKAQLRQQQGRGQELGARQTDESELDALYIQLKSQEDELARLTIKSPIDGLIYNLQPQITPHRWYGANMYLFSVAKENRFVVNAYVSEYDMHRIEYIEAPIFISNHPGTPIITLSLSNKPKARASILDSPYLASVFQGPIEVTQNQKAPERFEITPSVFQFRFIPTSNQNQIEFEQAGVLVMKVSRESYLVRWVKQLIGVLIRESEF